LELIFLNKISFFISSLANRKTERQMEKKKIVHLKIHGRKRGLGGSQRPSNWGQSGPSKGQSRGEAALEQGPRPTTSAFVGTAKESGNRAGLLEGF
jgi:hypothetical protein